MSKYESFIEAGESIKKLTDVFMQLNRQGFFREVEKLRRRREHHRRLSERNRLNPKRKQKGVR